MFVFTHTHYRILQELTISINLHETSQETLYVYMSKCCFIDFKSKHEERLIFDRLFVRVLLKLLNFPNPDNPYCTIPVSSFMINDDSHIHIVFPIICRCPRNKCYCGLSNQTSLNTPTMPPCKECKHSPSR